MFRADLEAAPDGDPEATTEPPVDLLCRSCAHPITTEAAVTAVGGKTDHIFTNPHGFTFHVRCFSTARTALAGTPTRRDTWFPGHAWQIAVCPRCKTHLGWAFSAERARFWGLIPAKLRRS